MKKIFFFLAVAVAAIACTPQETVTPKVDVLSDASSLVIATEGGEVLIDFDANVEWTAEFKEAADWCSLSPKSGAAGANKVKVIAIENANNENRSVTVVIKAQTATAEVVVEQLQKDALVAGATTLDVPAEGGEVKVKLGSNVDFEVKTDADWLTYVPSKAYTETDLVFNVAANTALEGRTAKITITAGALKQEVTVNQAAFVPTFEMDKTELWIASEGGTAELNITANFEYSVTVESDWLTVTNEGGKYTFTAVANPSFYYRAVEVVITGWSSEENKFYVFQNGRANVAWQKVTNTDYAWELNAEAVRMVVKGDLIILSNASNVLKIVDKATGTFLRDLALPEGMIINSLDLDDAGNIIACADFPYGGSTVVYRVTDINNPTPEPFGTLSNLNYWSGNPTGNFRVSGDVTKDALIVGIIGGVHQYMAFEVRDGAVVEKENWGPVYQPTEGTIWLPQNAAIYPLGTAIADGFLYVAYSKPYDLYKSAAEGNWDVLANLEGYTGNDIPNALDLKEIDGKKLLAVGCGAVFTWSGAGVLVYDVTDWSNVTLVGRWLVPDASSTAVNAGSDLTKHGQGSDVVLEDTEDGFRIYHFSAGNQRVTCVDVI